jgi:hypothetical protein
VPTDGALKILRRLVAMARDDPDAYVDRFTKLEKWSSSPAAQTMLPGIAADPDLEPLDSNDDQFHDDVPF